MKYRSKAFQVCFLWCAVLLMAVQAARVLAQPTIATELPVLLQPHKLDVAARGAVLVDAHTGQILVDFNKDERIPPASFVKVLTLYVVFEAIESGKIRLTDEVFISQKSWKTGGSQMFLEVNSRVQVEDLIKGIAIVSGNDACVALAEHISGGTEVFVSAMNDTAAKIGMKQSHFTNTHGLPDPEQYTTAYDMALLAQNYIARFPEAMQYHSLQEYTYAGIKQYNRNRLLRQDPSVDGLKTGYIAASGYHLLATARRDNRRLIAVVMGTEGPRAREREARKLLTYGYRNFELLPLFPKDQVVAEVLVWKGAQDSVALVPTTNGMLTVPTEHKGKFQPAQVIPAEVVAPITQGQVLGEATITLDTQVVKRIPLVAREAVAGAAPVKFLWHSAYLFGKNNLRVLFIGLVILLLPMISYALLTRKRKRGRASLRL